MADDKVAFIIFPQPSPVNLPLDAIMDHYARFRDAIANTPHIDNDSLPVVFANQTFVYAFNLFKAISLLLPSLYFEAAAPIVRQLWEVSLNLHWVFLDAKQRVTTFCGYTIMEYRKTLKIEGDGVCLDNFNEATMAFQKKYSFSNRKGREKQFENYSNMSIQQRADQLGEPWSSEYKTIYNLTSMHAHAAPGAILQAIFRSYYSNPIIRERDESALMAIIAIKIMMRNAELLVCQEVITDATEARREYNAFWQTLNAHTSTLEKKP